MRRYFFIILSIVFAISCKNESKTTSTPIEKTQNSTLPVLPLEDLEQLANNCTGVDYIFHELPISVSQSDKPSIRANLGLFTLNPITGSLKDCKSIAREFFQVDGDVKYEAEIYVGNGCNYHVWMDGNKPIYANQLSEEGIKFYNKLITSTKGMQSNGQ